MPRRFPPPWTAEQILRGYVVKDATGQSLATSDEGTGYTAKELTMDEAMRCPGY